MRRTPILLAAAAALALAACNNNPAANNMTAAPATPGIPAPAGPAPGMPSEPTATVAPANPQIAAQIEREVQQIQAQLPIRIDQVTNIVAVTAEGTEVVYSLRVAAPIPNPEQAQQAAQAHAQTNVCASPPAAAMVRQGVSMRYDYTDSAGTAFSSRVTTCP